MRNLIAEKSGVVCGITNTCGGCSTTPQRVITKRYKEKECEKRGTLDNVADGLLEKSSLHIGLRLMLMEGRCQVLDC